MSILDIPYHIINYTIIELSALSKTIIATTYPRTYVLWDQPIKLAQVASTSELLENQRNDLGFFKIIPSHFCRASEASKIDCLKIKYEKFGPRILIPR